MKPKSKILIAGCMFALSLSVMATTAQKAKSLKDDVATHYVHAENFDLSGIEPAGVTFVITYYNHDMLAGEPLVLDIVKLKVQVRYIGLKLNNKALPITNRLWLKNCQIALK